MENYDYRTLMAANVEDPRSSTTNPWPLHDVPRSRIAYKLYYYLLSISGRDHETGWAYISDKYWKKCDAAKILDCDPRSITNNLKTLVQKGLLTRDENRKAYIFNDPNINASIPCQVLAMLLKLDGEIDAVTAIRILSIVQYAAQHRFPSFTITDIKWALRNNNISGDFIRLCLGWWQSIGLLKVTVTTEYSGEYGYYSLYTKFSFDWKIAEMADGPLSEEFKKQFANVGT